MVKFGYVTFVRRGQVNEGKESFGRFPRGRLLLALLQDISPLRPVQGLSEGGAHEKLLKELRRLRGRPTK